MYKYFLLLIVSVSGFPQSIDAGYKLEENKYFSATDRKAFQEHLKDINIYHLSYITDDSVAVKGFLITPVNAGKKFPVLIYNRGGNGSYGMVTDTYIMMFLSKIASHGFIVIGSQLRGSECSGGADEFGGKDVNDVMHLFKIIDRLDNADTSKIAQIGWSRGGITNFQVLKKTDRIITTISIACPADLMKSREKMFDVYRSNIPGYSTDSVAVLKERAPLYQIDSVKNSKSSVLFAHGDADVHVDVSNSRQMHIKAMELGLKSELLIYPGEDHVLRAVWPDLIEKIVVWLRHEFEIN